MEELDAKPLAEDRPTVGDDASAEERQANDDASAEERPANDDALVEERPANDDALAEERPANDDALADDRPAPAALAEDRSAAGDDAQLKAILEAVVYVTDEPLSAQQIAAALGHPLDKIKRLLDELVAEYAKPEHGLSIREVAAGYKMATKAEHHEAVRAFVKRLTPPLKLSLAALETLAVVAFKQPVTAPEIMEIRGVQGAGVLRTLLDRKLISESGRKNVVGKPILYKTTKDFLVQFGLNNLNEMPTLKEFEELGRMEIVEPEAPAEVPQEAAPPDVAQQQAPPQEAESPKAAPQEAAHEPESVPEPAPDSEPKISE